MTANSMNELDVTNTSSKQTIRFISAILIVILIILQSCSSTTKILPNGYSELGNIDSKENTDYRIKLRDGTKYSATHISATDSLLTIITITASDDTRNNVSISKKLPYMIPLGEVESIEVRKGSKAPLYVVMGFVIVLGTFLIIDNNTSGSLYN